MLEGLAVLLLLGSNAAALQRAARYRRQVAMLKKVLHAVADGKKYDLLPCRCRHLLLRSDRPVKMCCDTAHSPELCQPPHDML